MRTSVKPEPLGEGEGDQHVDATSASRSSRPTPRPRHAPSTWVVSFGGVAVAVYEQFDRQTD